jgi:hypothetical protein
MMQYCDYLRIPSTAGTGQHETCGASLVRAVQAKESFDFLCLWRTALCQQNLQLFHRPQFSQNEATLQQMQIKQI